jgi:acetyltransferase-like isoleucine patch superfamily enzyme
MNYKIYDNCSIGQDVAICDYAVIGKPSRARHISFRGLKRTGELLHTIIGSKVYIGCHVVVEEGVFIGQSVVIDDGAIIESNVSIGANSFVVHAAKVCEGVIIGEDCVVGGLVGDNVLMGSRIRSFGKLIHKHSDPTLPWDGTFEEAPQIMDDAFIGFNATIVGGVKIGKGSYVAAGAIVTTNVPDGHVAIGKNIFIEKEKWGGKI